MYLQYKVRIENAELFEKVQKYALSRGYTWQGNSAVPRTFYPDYPHLILNGTGRIYRSSTRFFLLNPSRERKFTVLNFRWL